LSTDEIKQLSHYYLSLVSMSLRLLLKSW